MTVDGDESELRVACPDVPPRITQTLPAEQVPSCPRCAGRVWLDRACYRCGGELPDALGVEP